MQWVKIISKSVVWTVSVVLYASLLSSKSFGGDSFVEIDIEKLKPLHFDSYDPAYKNKTPISIETARGIADKIILQKLKKSLIAKYHWVDGDPLSAEGGTYHFSYLENYFVIVHSITQRTRFYKLHDEQLQESQHSNFNDRILPVQGDNRSLTKGCQAWDVDNNSDTAIYCCETLFPESDMNCMLPTVARDFPIWEVDTSSRPDADPTQSAFLCFRDSDDWPTSDCTNESENLRSAIAIYEEIGIFACKYISCPHLDRQTFILTDVRGKDQSGRVPTQMRGPSRNSTTGQLPKVQQLILAAKGAKEEFLPHVEPAKNVEVIAHEYLHGVHQQTNPSVGYPQSYPLLYAIEEGLADAFTMLYRAYHGEYVDGTVGGTIFKPEYVRDNAKPRSFDEHETDNDYYKYSKIYANFYFDWMNQEGIKLEVLIQHVLIMGGMLDQVQVENQNSDGTYPDVTPEMFKDAVKKGLEFIKKEDHIESVDMVFDRMEHAGGNHPEAPGVVVGAIIQNEFCEDGKNFAIFRWATAQNASYYKVWGRGQGEAFRYVETVSDQFLEVVMWGYDYVDWGVSACSDGDYCTSITAIDRQYNACNWKQAENFYPRCGNSIEENYDLFDLQPSKYFDATR